MHQIYEPLLIRDASGKVLPTLALSWAVTSDPTVWEFKLRQGVKFHNGNPFNADDVVFSLERARQPTSDMKGLLSSIEKVSKVDDYTVHIKTKGPNPLLPNYLTNMFMMDKEWSEANNTITVQDYKGKKDNFAVRNANGTGPYAARVARAGRQDRAQAQRWLLGQGQVSSRHYRHHLSHDQGRRHAHRGAAVGRGRFRAGRARAGHRPGGEDREHQDQLGPENRTIFFGMDVASPELQTSNIKGKNPFADKRVRQAINMAIDREAIKRAVMRGQSVPAGVIAPPFVNGYTKELDALPKVDLAKAAALLKEAGYADGFQVTLHCPNDRYINDEGICQAATAMLAKIGIKVNLVAQSRGPHFTLIQKTPPETEFYMVGWGVPTYDSQYIFSFLYHTRSGSDGSWNATRYSKPDVDAAIQSLNSEIDTAKRNATIAKIWKTVGDETNYIALHHQMLAYAMKNDLDIPVSPENTVFIKFVAAK